MHLSMIGIITSVCMVSILQIAYGCFLGQVKRLNGNAEICCVPVMCKPGQQFSLCQENNGHDTCQNCPHGFGHKDWIDTSIWSYQIDPCRELEDCSHYSDLREEEGECVCDRTKGYFGLDRNLCSVDRNHTCKKAGYQLTPTGDCEKCGVDYFKDLEDYSLCKEKTRCESDQEINNPGSHMKDRSCRKKTRWHIPKPFTRKVSNEGHGHGYRKNHTENRKFKELGGHNSTNFTKVFDENNGESTGFEKDSVHQEKSENKNTEIIIVVVPVLVAIAILIGLLACIVCKRKGTCSGTVDDQDYGHHSIHNFFTCCVKQVAYLSPTYNIHNNTDNSSRTTYNVHGNTAVNIGENPSTVVNGDGKPEFTEEKIPMVV